MKFLIDVNLPYYFGLWSGENFIHQLDINPKSKDSEIWEFAKNNDYIIVTKDSDFSNRILLNDPPPRVIHVKIGNLSMKDFHKFIHVNWPIAVEMISTHKLVNIYLDSIEGIQ